MILEKAHKGVSVNGFVLFLPTKIKFSDYCSQGLCGLIHGGRGWRLKINLELIAYREDISNNHLEFYGMALTILLLLIGYKEHGLIDEMIFILEDNICTIF